MVLLNRLFLQGKELSFIQDTTSLMFFQDRVSTLSTVSTLF